MELAGQEPKIVKNFYLTGGTALAEFYLHHRYSEDIDLFCEKQEVDQTLVEIFLKKTSAKLGVVKIKKSVFLGLTSYIMVYPDKSELKIDFNYYPFPRIDKGVTFKNIQIDSLYDIAANKIHTLFVKPRGRDYIDLYCIMTQTNYPLKKLIIDAKAKFDWDIDAPTLASQFLRVTGVTDLPKMLAPFHQRDMEKFFLSLAKELKKEIFK